MSTGDVSRSNSTERGRVMIKDITEKKKDKLVALLKEDVRWLIETHGPKGFDPDFGLCVIGGSFSRISVYEGLTRVSCGTCIVGAHLLRRFKGDIAYDSSDYRVFAERQKLTEGQAKAIYHGATLSDEALRFPRCALIAAEVLVYALTLGWKPDPQNVINRRGITAYAKKVKKLL